MWLPAALFAAAFVMFVGAWAEGKDQCNTGPQAKTPQQGLAMLQLSSDRGGHAHANSTAPNVSLQLINVHTQVNSSAPSSQVQFGSRHAQAGVYKGIGEAAHLTEEGYGEVSRECSHPEMYLFAERVIKDLGLELCDTGSLEGTVKYHTCDDSQSLKKLKEDLQKGTSEQCAWVSQPGSCRDVVGKSAALTEDGYAAVSKTCCQLDMEQFAERVVAELGFEICNLGGLSGILRHHNCENGVQTLAKLREDVHSGESGTCAWVGKAGKCPPYDGEICGQAPFHHVQK